VKDYLFFRKKRVGSSGRLELVLWVKDPHFLRKIDLIKKLLVQQSELRKERNCFYLFMFSQGLSVFAWHQFVFFIQVTSGKSFP